MLNSINTVVEVCPPESSAIPDCLSSLLYLLRIDVDNSMFNTVIVSACNCSFEVLLQKAFVHGLNERIEHFTPSEGPSDDLPIEGS